MQHGTAEHAAGVTQGRQPGIRDGLQWLTYAHLPEPLRKFSSLFYDMAVEMLTRITTDSPELTTALNKIIEAKDSAMRAGIRMDTGRAGSVPRPQEVVNPPTLTGVASRTDWHDAERATADARRATGDVGRFRPIKDNPQG